MANVRLQRLASDYKEKLNILLKTEINNEYASYCTVVDVEITSDLSFATIYVDTLANPNKALEALKRVSGFLRSQLAKNSTVRTTPKLIFKIDQGIQSGNRIEQLLREIKEKNNN